MATLFISKLDPASPMWYSLPPSLVNQKIVIMMRSGPFGILYTQAITGFMAWPNLQSKMIYDFIQAY